MRAEEKGEGEEKEKETEEWDDERKEAIRRMTIGTSLLTCAALVRKIVFKI
jgi:hypothetical protein